MIKSNLAELIPVTINKTYLEQSWNLFLKEYEGKVLSSNLRIFVEYDELPRYFKYLIDSITNYVSVKPKNYIFQVTGKKILNIVHRDKDRNCCITIPILYNVMEPVMFYKDIYGLEPEQIRKLESSWPDKPYQISKYSEKHPTLVNIQTLHNVQIINEESPRILFQLSYDIGFDEMIHKNPSIWQGL